MSNYDAGDERMARASDIGDWRDSCPGCSSKISVTYSKPKGDYYDKVGECRNCGPVPLGGSPRRAPLTRVA